MNKNIVYQTDQLARYFTQNRVSWVQFYESERKIIKQLHMDSRHKVLDVGCGIGGPMRNICKFTGADVTGLTLNQYQVEVVNNFTTSCINYYFDLATLSNLMLIGT